MKIKVLYVETYYHIGGGQQGLLDLLKNIDKDKFEITIILPKEDTPLYNEVSKIPDINIEILEFDNIPFIGKITRTFVPIYHPLGVYRLKKLIKKIDPHIVHANHLLAARYSAKAARQAGYPNIVTVRNVYYKKRFNLNIFVDRRIYKNATLIIFNSETGAKVFQERTKAKNITFIRNAVDLSKFDTSPLKKEEKIEFLKKYNIPLDKRYIIYVGTLSWIKGIFSLLEAYKRLSKEFDDIHLIYVGGGVKETPESERLKSLIKEYSLENRITITGFTKEVEKFYKIAYVNVLPSVLGEGLPRVLIESSYFGLPSVASDIAGVKEIIRDGENGFLVKKGDINDLYKKLKYILTISQQEYEKLTKKGRLIVEQDFNFKKFIEKYEGLYLDLYKKYYNNA